MPRADRLTQFTRTHKPSTNTALTPPLRPFGYSPSMVAGEPSITVAHDYFTQRGGAERVAAALVQIFTPERVVTAVYSPSTTFPLQVKTRVETSFLQNISYLRKDPRRALVLLPLAWQFMKPVDTRVLICSTSGWSHALKARSGTTKIVYCHNPARWLYQPDDYSQGHNVATRLLLKCLRPALKVWDRRAARTANLYIANSTSVAERIKRAYDLDAEILHPPVTINPDAPKKAIHKAPESFFLAVGRGRGYKNIEVLVEAFRALPHEHLLVVGEVTAGIDLPPNVSFYSNLTDEELRWAYDNAVALISVALEDFGLTPIEANAFGTPALVLRAGGFLDTLREGLSGQFISEATPESVEKAVRTFPRSWDKEQVRAHAASFSSDSFAQKLRLLIRQHAKQ